MSFSTLSLLCLLAWSLPCTLSSSSVEFRGWQRSARDPKPLLFHTVNRLLPHIPTYCDALMYHEVPYDFKYDWPAECPTSGVCLFRENQDSSWICGNAPETHKQTSWPFHKWSVDHGWVSTGELASTWRVQWKLSAWQCWECTVFSCLSARR